MACNQRLQCDATKLLIDADHYHWIHQTNWQGEPCLQLPQDLMAMADVIYHTEPEVVVECGVAWGGTTLFLASQPSIKEVICIDIYLPADLIERLTAKSRAKLSFLEGSSIDPHTFKSCQDLINDRDAFVILDSNHTEDHVYNELVLYSQLIKCGQYILCDDTIIEAMKDPARNRLWGPGNNPFTALQRFLAENPGKFRQDALLTHKLLLTCAPGGFLQRVAM
jgi:cephalosporin hydroxylase